jgi:xanthine dehydrogenase accessory factor
MMRAWLQPAIEALSRGEAATLVHLVELKGSGPRDVGAQMIVTERDIIGTIGGGEFEREATLRARELLQTGRAGLLSLALGPQLNQCCGGSVTVAFEPFAPADLAWLKKLARAAEEQTPVVRAVQFDEGGRLRREWAEDASGNAVDFAVVAGNGRTLLKERINPRPQALWLFGAGHVGRAVAYAVAPLGFAMTWIDGRAGQFPDSTPAGAKCLALAMPELAVDEAPPDTVFAVMTHSHPLDEAICDAILRRDDFAYLGLIGSATKRARFVKRLGEAGIASKRLKRLVCPIGLPNIESKEPAAIAASFAADLLMRRERNLLHSEAALSDG